MEKANPRIKQSFLYPRSRYYAQIIPENLAFNANLQEFSQKVSYICNLQTNGKLPPYEAYRQLKSLWKQLKRTKKQLAIGESFSGKKEDKIDDC